PGLQAGELLHPPWGGADFRGHRPAVSSNRPFQGALAPRIGRLTPASVHPAAPVLLQKGPPVLHPHFGLRSGRTVFTSLRSLKGRVTRASQALIILSRGNEGPNERTILGKFRREPATRWFDWFSPYTGSASFHVKTRLDSAEFPRPSSCRNSSPPIGSLPRALLLPPLGQGKAVAAPST
ncbi:hypothetical protein TNIN_364201, partial [Trichonephila inaurata madagascariensis]